MIDLGGGRGGDDRDGARLPLPRGGLLHDGRAATDERNEREPLHGLPPWSERATCSRSLTSTASSGVTSRRVAAPLVPR
jgi:hypothetical protein